MINNNLERMDGRTDTTSHRDAWSKKKQVKKSFSSHPAPNMYMARNRLKIVANVLRGQWYLIPLEYFYSF